MNADAADGSVRVELLNDDGYRVRGFSRDDAVPMKGDSLRHIVAWNGKTLDQLPAGPYLLRIHLDRATVFAITLTP